MRYRRPSGIRQGSPREPSIIHASRLRRAALPLEFLVPARRLAPGGTRRARAGAGLRRRWRSPTNARSPASSARTWPPRRRAAADRRQRVRARLRAAPRPAGDRPRQLRQSLPAHHPRAAPGDQGQLRRSAATTSPRSRTASSRCGCRRTGRCARRPTPTPRWSRRAAGSPRPSPAARGSPSSSSPAPATGARLARVGGARAACGLPLVAAGDVHMHVRARRALQDTLTAIRLGTPLAECGYALFPNGERHLRSRARLASSIRPSCWRRRSPIAARCRFSLDELRYEYPEELVPPGATPAAHLRRAGRGRAAAALSGAGRAARRRPRAGRARAGADRRARLRALLPHRPRHRRVRARRRASSARAAARRPTRRSATRSASPRSIRRA